MDSGGAWERVGETWERLAPGLAPGGLVFRLTAGGRVFTDRRFPFALGDLGALVEKVATEDGLMAAELAERFGEARNYVYDGDTGDCVATLVVEPPDEPPEWPE